VIVPDEEQRLIFNIKDSYLEFHNRLNGCCTNPPTPPCTPCATLTATHLLKKAWLNDEVIWSEDIAFGGDGWERVEIDLTPFLSDIKTDGEKNTLRIGFAIEDGEDVSIANVQGVKVWVDDVYMKKYGDTEGKNIITDGNFESGDPIETTGELGEWYVSGDIHLSHPLCTGMDPRAYAGNGNEQKSGRNAVMLQLDYITVGCTNGGTYPTNNYEPLCFVAQDFDFKELLGCNYYAGLGFLPFPVTDNTAITSTVDVDALAYYLDHSITIGLGGELNLTGTSVAIDVSNGPVSITVENGGKLSMVQGVVPSSSPPFTVPTYLFACGNMWEGIINDGVVDIQPGAPDFYHTRIEDAKTAILNNSGALKIQYAVFDQNKTSINLQGGTTSATFIQGCEFKCSTGKIKKSPHAGKIPYEHVHVEDIISFTIPLGYANSGSGSGLKNNYSDAFRAIGIKKSSVSIVNSTFKNI